MEPTHAIIVVNYGSHLLLEQNLAPLTRALGPGTRAIVVDNFSTADEAERVRRLADHHGWTALPQTDNRGFGAANNHAIFAGRELGCRTFLLLNPDVQIDADVARDLLRDAETHPMDLVAPVVHDADGRIASQGHVVDLRSGAMHGLPTGERSRAVLTSSDAYQRPWLTAAVVAGSAELFETAGGFAEDYFLYWEDVDLSLRVTDVGGRLVLRRDLCATHTEGGTQRDTRNPAKSALYYYYNARNRLVFARRHAPSAIWPRWVVGTPAETAQIYLRGGRRQLLENPGSALAAIRGGLHGVRYLLRPRSRRARGGS